MVLALLWLPFVLLGAAVGFGLAMGRPLPPQWQSFRTDRLQTLPLVFGFLGPVSILIVLCADLERRYLTWLQEPEPPTVPKLPPACRPGPDFDANAFVDWLSDWNSRPTKFRDSQSVTPIFDALTATQRDEVSRISRERAERFMAEVARERAEFHAPGWLKRRAAARRR